MNNPVRSAGISRELLFFVTVNKTYEKKQKLFKNYLQIKK
jgi:hypothetical protein